MPAEAHRRLRADERQAAAKRVHSREADLALHQEKLRYIADWVEQHGTADQRVRHAAGVLPIPRSGRGARGRGLCSRGAKPLYERDGAAQLQAYLRQFPGYADVVVGRGEFSLFNTAAVKATAAQWALVQEIREALPVGERHPARTSASVEGRSERTGAQALSRPRHHRGGAVHPQTRVRGGERLALLRLLRCPPVLLRVADGLPSRRGKLSALPRLGRSCRG